MYGGIKPNQQNDNEQVALGELWQFDLNTQSWLKIHDTLGQKTPLAFGAFAYVTQDSQIYLFIWGGLANGFHKDHTFKPVGKSG